MDHGITQSALDLIYLCGCVLTGEPPQSPKRSGADLPTLYALSQLHSLMALVCEGLEGLDLPENTEGLSDFRTARNMALRKNLLLDTDRSQLLTFLEREEIWSMPLKGVILKELYPKMGLRQMSDNDTLFDETHRPYVIGYGHTGCSLFQMCRPTTPFLPCRKVVLCQ